MFNLGSCLGRQACRPANMGLPWRLVPPGSPNVSALAEDDPGSVKTIMYSSFYNLCQTVHHVSMVLIVGKVSIRRLVSSRPLGRYGMLLSVATRWKLPSGHHRKDGLGIAWPIVNLASFFQTHVSYEQDIPAIANIRLVHFPATLRHGRRWRIGAKGTTAPALKPP